MLRTLKHLADTVRAMRTMLTLFRYIYNEFLEEMLCVFHSHTANCMRHGTVGVMPNRCEVFPEEPILPLRKITAVINLLDSILVADFQYFHFCFPVLSLQFLFKHFDFFSIPFIEPWSVYRPETFVDATCGQLPIFISQTISFKLG